MSQLGASSIECYLWNWCVLSLYISGVYWRDAVRWSWPVLSCRVQVGRSPHLLRLSVVYSMENCELHSAR
jgi:hypothetical protein